jgi:predicted DNA-binding transcriptional regulator AlpA
VNDNSLLISFEDTADLLGISRALLYQMHSSGILGPVPFAIGRRKLFRRDQIEAWVMANMPSRIQWLGHAPDKSEQKTGFSSQKSSKTPDCLSGGGKK